MVLSVIGTTEMSEEKQATSTDSVRQEWLSSARPNLIVFRLTISAFFPEILFAIQLKLSEICPQILMFWAANFFHGGEILAYKPTAAH